jgi:hypothetical protein
VAASTKPFKRLPAEPLMTIPPTTPPAATPPTPPANPHLWRDRVDHWSKIIGATLALIGLFLTWGQLRDNGQALDANTIEQIYSRMHDIDKLFVEHPELKPYFYADMRLNDRNPLVEKLGLNEALVKAQVPALAELICDFFAQALLQLKNLPPGAYEGWRNYFKAVYMRSPELRDYYKANAQWYQYEEADRLFKEADTALAAQAEASARAAVPR